MSLSILNPSTATAQESRGASRLIRCFIYAGLAMALLFGFVVVRFFLWAQCFELRAFVSRGGSMCPAICEDERVIAGMDAFNKRVPQRGEVILFDQRESNTKFVKRVIAVAGDTVARGPSNTILVNNKPLVLPPVCGEHNKYLGLAAWGPPFESSRPRRICAPPACRSSRAPRANCSHRKGPARSHTSGSRSPRTAATI